MRFFFYLEVVEGIYRCLEDVALEEEYPVSWVGSKVAACRMSVRSYVFRPGEYMQEVDLIGGQNVLQSG